MRAALALGVILLAGSVHAAEFTTHGSMLSVVGEIMEGDRIQFGNAVKSSDVPIEAVSMDSPGGQIGESMLMGNIIRSLHLVTVVPAGGRCASACFLMFAAGEQRAIGLGARIGVHSAKRFADSTEDSAEGTLIMARAAAKFGVPESIVGSMIETSSHEAYWLSQDDLNSMNVTILDGENVKTAPRQAIPVEQAVITENSTKPADYKTLTGVLVRAQCHMDVCFWFSIESIATLSENGAERLVSIMTKNWRADYPDGNYTRKVNRRFDGDMHSYVFCSRSRPQILDEGGSKGWLQVALAPGDNTQIFGFLEDSLSMYWAACHGQKVEDGGFGEVLMAQSLGYPATALRGTVGQYHLDALPSVGQSSFPAVHLPSENLSIVGADPAH